MAPLLLVLLLQPPAPAGPTVELPVSLDRIREGLGRPDRFRVPPPRAARRPVFRVRIEQAIVLFGEPWDDSSLTPPWVRPLRPPAHFDFLASVMPEDVRGLTLHPCCPVAPLVSGVTNLVSKGVRRLKERRAKREVERVMREAGIRR